MATYNRDLNPAYIDASSWKLGEQKPNDKSMNFWRFVAANFGAKVARAEVQRDVSLSADPLFLSEHEKFLHPDYGGMSAQDVDRARIRLIAELKDQYMLENPGAFKADADAFAAAELSKFDSAVTSEATRQDRRKLIQQDATTRLFSESLPALQAAEGEVEDLQLPGVRKVLESRDLMSGAAAFLSNPRLSLIHI